MEDYIVSARKYRPTTFEEVAGQEAITSTLLNAISNKLYYLLDLGELEKLVVLEY